VDENSVENLIAELEATAAKFPGNGGGGGNRSSLLVEQDHERVARRMLHTARRAGHVCTDSCSSHAGDASTDSATQAGQGNPDTATQTNHVCTDNCNH